MMFQISNHKYQISDFRSQGFIRNLQLAVLNFTRRVSILTLLINEVAVVTRAQHPDVRPFVDNGRLMTKGYDDETSQETAGLRVFGVDFGEFDPPDQFFATDPGFNAAPGSGLPVGSQLSFNIPDATVFGLTSNFSYWDGNGDLQLSRWTSPGGVQLRLNLGSSNMVVGAAAGFQPGFDIQTVQAGGVVHRHLGSFLDQGVPDPALGIYLLPMELKSSDPAIEKSLPFFIVYNNGMSEKIHDTAIDWVQMNLLTIPGDFTGDGKVDGADFVVWQTNFPKDSGGTLGTGDANGDGKVDCADFVVWQTHFPYPPIAAMSVPESSGLLICAMAAGAVYIVRRRRAAVRAAAGLVYSPHCRTTCACDGDKPNA